MKVVFCDTIRKDIRKENFEYEINIDMKNSKNFLFKKDIVIAMNNFFAENDYNITLYVPETIEDMDKCYMLMCYNGQVLHKIEKRLDIEDLRKIKIKNLINQNEEN
jgi:hypothetical protein